MKLSLSLAQKAALAAGALAAADLCLVAPGREHNGKWQHMRQFRYAHRGLHDQPAGASLYPDEGCEPAWKKEPPASDGTVIPENSLAAFRRAAEKGFGAELDVHLTKDGRLAVVHDSNLMRVTGRAGVVEELTCEELGEYRLLGTDEGIPLLEDVLPIFETSATPLIVEIKPENGNFDTLTAAAVGCLDQSSVCYCMESFDPRVLLWLRRNRPEIIRGQLAMDFIRHPGTVSPVNRVLLTNLVLNSATRPHFIAYSFEDRHVLNRFLCCNVLKGHSVYWTIRNRHDMELAEKEGALVIFEKFIP